MAKLIVFLGRNTEGILTDAFREFGGGNEVIVVSRDGDALEPPYGLEAVPVSRFQPEENEHYVLIANGGTSAQLVPVLARLVETYYASFEAWDLQRDGKSLLWKYGGTPDPTYS